MKRREALRLIAGAAVLPILSHDLLALGRGIQSEIGPHTVLKTLNPHQNATVITMAELIIPATETPGAKAARVNEFIDHVLTDWSRDNDRKRFLDGLAQADVRSRSLFGKDFIQCSRQQQIEFLLLLDNELARLREEVPRKSRKPSARKDDDLSQTPVEKNFFHNMKRLTLLGYYTSEIGWTQELGRPAFHFGPYQACTAVTSEKGNSGN
jgi:glucoside 3-dehydrogenase (cytochrome c) hitch-hiker subunit